MTESVDNRPYEKADDIKRGVIVRLIQVVVFMILGATVWSQAGLTVLCATPGTWAWLSWPVPCR